jgi:uncharacterized protein
MTRPFARACASLVAVAMLLLAAVPAVAVDVPYLTGRVVDNAEILKPATREGVAALAKAHEDKTTDQIAVLTLPTLGGESVEEFAVRVFEAWKLGQKGKDNGVLLIVAPQDRKIRIEVGYGLEGTLSDVAASRIIRNVMTPAFKSGDFDRGIEDGVKAIVAQLEGQTATSGTTASFADTSVAGGARRSTFKFEGPDMPWHMRILLGCFIFSIIGIFTVVGVMTPGRGWFLYVFLIPFWAMFPMMIIGPKPTLGLLALYLIGYPAAKLWLARQPWYAKAAADLKAKGTTTIGGMVVTSGGSSASGGGGGSSGGFAGGGGSSGGGGASGSW